MHAGQFTIAPSARNLSIPRSTAALRMDEYAAGRGDVEHACRRRLFDAQLLDPVP
jgi:hypothetical protein